MMQHIKVQVPLVIPAANFKRELERHIKAAKRYECKVKFIELNDDQNIFQISSNCSEGFYQIGILTAMMIHLYNTRAAGEQSVKPLIIAPSEHSTNPLIVAP
ncbi:hypothetical protein ACFOWM_03600 [Ferruginibacter yonginensis]|uniref:Uncharacterized protein n=1 Tax=Ferruginibacter yonginensis TaxID=1310416 RepID=A0ABV8QSD6_9BACT